MAVTETAARVGGRIEHAASEARERAADRLENVRERAAERFEPARDRLADAVEPATDRAKEVLLAAPELVAWLSDYVEKRIDEEQVRRFAPKVGLAAGGFFAGFVIGWFAARRRSDDGWIDLDEGVTLSAETGSGMRGGPGDDGHSGTSSSSISDPIAT